MICSSCKKDKHALNFAFKCKAKRKRRSICKACAKIYKRKYYYANRQACIDRSKINTKNLRNRNRQFVWDYLKKQKCIDCGENNPIVLDFDHRDNEKKQLDISRMVMTAYSLKTIQKEIKKCDIRCSNCHRIRTSISQNWYYNINK